MNITYAKYEKNLDDEVNSVHIIADGKDLKVPMDIDNTDYAEIMRQVEAGELVIQEAE
jgi:hypothetical protein